jgi:ABC-2 type transport system ATP-binding protein
MIRIQNVTKYYGARLAVDDISFNVKKGETVGFLGPNAAGKTTTMRMITGYLMPTRGDVWIADYNMATHSLDGRRLIGYLPEIVPLYTDMTTRAYLEYAARLRGLNKAKTRNRLDEVVTQCGLEQYIGVTLGKLSKGFKQRVGLAQAIIHDPQVLILDEPTIGIDPIQVAQTRQLIRQLGKDRTILLSTHILPEASMICERVIIIHEGKVVARDRIENLSAILRGGNRIHLKVQGHAGKITERLGQIDSIRSVTYESPFHIVEFAADREPRSEIMEAMVQNDWTLLAMESVEMSLEDIFLQLTTREETDS